jgi:hypothetical protein
MTKYIFITVLISLVINVSLFAQENLNQNNTEKINWTDEYNPAKSKFFVHNEIEINAATYIVWEFLIDALKWEAWYSGAKNVSFTNSNDTVMQANSGFNWNTMGMKFQSSIKQYEPNNLLAWESKKKSIQAYTVWLIMPTDNGCRVVVDESQNGWLTAFEKILERNKLRKMHDVWLAELKKISEEKQNKLQ